MQLVVSPLDCDPFLAEKKQPTLFLRREKPPERNAPYAVAKVFPGKWYVAGAIQPGSPVEWSLTKDGEWVRIPLFSYTTNAKDFGAVFGTGMQLGALAMSELPDDARPDKMQLVLGSVYEVEEGYQLWAGVAYRSDH